MRVLVNALSVSNLSGRHVLLGHLSTIARWTRGEHQYVVLHHQFNRDICRNLGGNVQWQECPAFTARWAGRAAWEILRLPRLAAQLRVDFMFTTSGAVISALPLPQVSYAMNPWSLVNGLDRSWLEQLKAKLQRRNYKVAVNKAAMMIFLSEYMRQEYRRNAGHSERASEVVYVALDEATHTAAQAARNHVARERLQILSVSAMAPHKGAETLVEALAMVRAQYGIPAHLIMAGPWPDAAYERKIRSLIQRLGLAAAVDIRGQVSREELHGLYAQSRVFSLMSHCESFGIPAVEAQAFGTPVVSSKCCAIPEVCGAGGIYPQPGDAAGTAEQLARLLSDSSDWRMLSAAAVENANKYRWELCSRKLLTMFDVFR